MDVPRLDAWSLHCLAVLINERNVTRAGALLELSQPATSAILAKLRILFGDALLVKSSTGMIPTPRGLELALQAEQVLEGMRRMTQPSETDFDAFSFKGSVAIAATDIVRLLILPELIKVLEVEAPGLTLKLSNADRTRVHERLERAELDMGLGPQEVSSGRLHFRELWTDSATCLMRTDVIAPNEKLTLDKFLQLSHIKLVPSQPSHFDDQLDKLLFLEGKRRNVAVLEPNFLMVPSLLSASHLVATVPKRFADRVCQSADYQQYVPPVTLGQMSIGIYWHERTHKESLFRWLRARICALAESVI
jgi:DNA-binding transcriptional LysR family regulator